MCGIIGYIGHQEAQNILLDGLHRLEYRGYDSAGIVVLHEGELTLRKKAGRVQELSQLVAEQPVTGTLGIGHTRWATHGEVNDVNSHPHFGGEGEVCLVHNGVIENYTTLRDALKEKGYEFKTATDSEVVAHLLAYEYKQLLEKREGETSPKCCLDAVQLTLKQLKGTYGLVVLFRDIPGTMIVARVGSPLVIGIGNKEHFVASDAGPLAGHTDEVVYLSDNELAIITAEDLKIIHRDTGAINPKVQIIEQADGNSDLGDFEHYMLKEIYEQPHAVENALRGRFNDDEATAVFGGLNMTAQQLRRIDRIVLTACGTSWHAGLVGEYLLEEFARIPTEVEYASELRYRNPPMSENTMIFAITQSGETADTLAAMRECKRKGHPTLAICNVVGSTIAREADGGIYLHAGPEIGVASTKAFTSQVTVLTLLALFFGRMRHLSYPAGKRIIRSLQEMPELMEQTLKCHEMVKYVAEKYANNNNFLYLGRLYNFPVALEGALKLKEISYIHAEGYPAAEMKHGPLALVDDNTPSVFVVPKCGIYPKVISNLEEVKARKGPVIAIACQGDEKIAELADDVIYVPDVEEYLQPLITSIPLQLLSYHIALLRKCNVDRPRNLAKSVTVE